MSTRGGRVPGAEGYNDNDVHALLACVADVRPTNKREWLRVLKLYRKRYAEPQMRSQRDVNSIKCKFRQILNLKLKAGSGGKPNATSTEAHKIQLAIQTRMHSLMTEGRPADDVSDGTDSDAEHAPPPSAPVKTTHSAPPPTQVAAAAHSPPLYTPEQTRPTPVVSDAANRASPRRQLLAPTVTTTTVTPPTPVAAPLRTPPQLLASNNTMAAAATYASPPQRTVATPLPLPPTAATNVTVATDAPESPLLTARLVALEQHNTALSAQLHAMNHAAQQQLAARVVALEQSNSALTGRLHAVSDAADALKSANYDLREQILELQRHVARVETENRELRAATGSNAAAQPTGTATSSNSSSSIN